MMGSKVFHFPILKGWYRYGIHLLSICVLALALLLTAVQPAQAAVPTFIIVNVVADTSVTIQTFNFPADQLFTVRMGPYGTLGIGGVVVATTNSGAGGSFEATYSIPAALAGSNRIAIRMDSTDGYYAYNWFYNNTVAAVPGYSGIPTFSILSVIKDDKVTIRTNNFPAGLDFTVRMGAYGTKGIGGTVVGTTNSGAGGTFDATYSIPDGLKGSNRIAIRLESDAGYYAYNWFWNNTAGGSTSAEPTVPGYTGIPTFSIVGVVRDSTVKIQTYNLPPDQDFIVYMGPYGTLGIGGMVVGNFNSGAGGSQSQTWSIPAALAGSTKIAIRMESNLGYFAYNWFWNNTTS